MEAREAEHRQLYLDVCLASPADRRGESVGERGREEGEWMRQKQDGEEIEKERGEVKEREI